MKNIIKTALLAVMLVIFIGSIGAYDNNSISALRCLAQCGICTVGSWFIMKGWCK